MTSTDRLQRSMTSRMSAVHLEKRLSLHAQVSDNSGIISRVVACCATKKKTLGMQDIMTYRIPRTHVFEQEIILVDPQPPGFRVALCLRLHFGWVLVGIIGKLVDAQCKRRCRTHSRCPECICTLGLPWLPTLISFSIHPKTTHSFVKHWICRTLRQQSLRQATAST